MSRAAGNPEAWKGRAACRDHDPDLWFPVHETPQLALVETREARAICRTCPVASPCLASAIENDDRFGVFGGVTAAARSRIIAPNGRAALNADRIRAAGRRIDELRAAGLSTELIAERLGVDDKTVWARMRSARDLAATEARRANA